MTIGLRLESQQNLLWKEKANNKFKLNYVILIKEGSMKM